jgi:hypothetical protein
MHGKFGTPRLLPSQINELIKRCLSLGSVREGLYPFQVVIALREMGFEPHYFPRAIGDDPAIAAKIVYGYVESQIPVILALTTRSGGHAVTVVGHDFKIRANPDPGWNSNIHWIDNFYINDDAQGPYLKLGLDQVLPEECHSGYCIKDNVVGVIVPTPREVRMRLDDVLDHIKVLMEGRDFLLNALLEYFKGIDRNALFRPEDFDHLVFRTFLVKSNDFKTGLPVDEDYAPIRALYKGVRMPKYVWVTEISTAELINCSEPPERKRLGEIVIDSTADRHSILSSYLAIHFRGRLILKKPEAQAPFRFHYFPNEKPCPHVIRGCEQD